MAAVSAARQRHRPELAGYQQGLGVTKDETEAVRLFQQAAAQGRLGLMYAEGRGVAKDETEAVRLFQQAAAQGYALGQYGSFR
jgi:uncharacterized protein